MRKHYESVFRQFFHRKLFQSRVQLEMTQEQMADRLAMASRSYIDLDHGKTGCSALTLVLYLIYICTEPIVFLEELRNAFETDDSWAA